MQLERGDAVCSSPNVDFLDDELQDSVHRAELLPEDPGITFQPYSPMDKDRDGVKISLQVFRLFFLQQATTPQYF